MVQSQKQQRKKVPGRPFKKGQTGNPNGRPKKAGSLLEALEQAGTPTAMKSVGAVVWKHAQRGESWAVNLLLDRFHGKVADRHELTGDKGGPVKFTITMETNAGDD